MHVHICECYPAFCLSPSHFTPVFANSSNHQPLFLSLFKKISSFSFPTSLHSPIIPRLLKSSDINPILLSLSLCLFSHYSPSIPSVSLAPISPFCIFFLKCGGSAVPEKTRQKTYWQSYWWFTRGQPQHTCGNREEELGDGHSNGGFLSQWGTGRGGGETPGTACHGGAPGCTIHPGSRNIWR